MKILSVALFCLFLAGCASAPSLEFPTGDKSARHPINVQQPPLSVLLGNTAANQAADGLSQGNEALPTPKPGTAPKPSIRIRTVPASEIHPQPGQ